MFVWLVHISMHGNVFALRHHCGCCLNQIQPTFKVRGLGNLNVGAIRHVLLMGGHVQLGLAIMNLQMGVKCRYRGRSDAISNGRNHIVMKGGSDHEHLASVIRFDQFFFQGLITNSMKCI